MQWLISLSELKDKVTCGAKLYSSETVQALVRDDFSSLSFQKYSDSMYVCLISHFINSKVWFVLDAWLKIFRLRVFSLILFYNLIYELMKTHWDRYITGSCTLWSVMIEKIVCVFNVRYNRKLFIFIL